MADSPNNPGRELATLDFANLIGGPLNAVVDAQAKSALTTVDFIRQVGFDKNGELINVDFNYSRNNDNNGTDEFTLSVPLITMLPLPYVSVKEAEISFNAKITSTKASEASDSLKTELGLDMSARGWLGSAKLDTKTAYQKNTESKDKEERTFDMNVTVKARNVDMPPGCERILSILEQAISEQSLGTIYKLKMKPEAATKQLAITKEVNQKLFDKLSDTKSTIVEAKLVSADKKELPCKGEKTGTAGTIQLLPLDAAGQADFNTAISNAESVELVLGKNP